MTIEIAFFKGSGLVSPALEAEVRAGIDDAIHALDRAIALGSIEIAVHLRKIIAQETGLGGYA